MRRLLNLHPNPGTRLALAILPFVAVLATYLVASQLRLAENPGDKMLPAFSSFAEAMHRLALEPSARTGQYDFWRDTLASLRRLSIGVGASAAIGLTLGLAMGVVPVLRATVSPFVACLSMVPPMAVLPILFIALGLGEQAKIVLIVIGIAPGIVREIELRALEIPAEQIIKAQTLGASTWQYALRVALPQVMPRLLTAVRLQLGPAWLFVISSEAIAATEGLGYRIFLVRRYLAMDVILPYVVWITLLAFAMDFALRAASRRLCPWAPEAGARA
ncbi:MAG: ABC transporter permease [Gammaproteobacteria bacterium]